MITEQPPNPHGLLEFPMDAEFDGTLVGLPGRVFRTAEARWCCDGGCVFQEPGETDTYRIKACDQIACMRDLRQDGKYQTIKEVT